MVDDDVLLGLYKLLRKRSIDGSGPVLIGIYQVIAIHWVMGLGTHYTPLQHIQVNISVTKLFLLETLKYSSLSKLYKCIGWVYISYIFLASQDALEVMYFSQ